jgi:uncharacterized secreted protein with C-terminal beta-propeller domain
MTKKNKTISFRVSGEKFEDLKEIAEEEDMSLSDLMRGRADNMLDVYEIGDEAESSTTEFFDEHVDSLVGDENYRNIHDAFYQDNRSFEEFVREEDYFDTKWVDETTVDYDEMLDKFGSVVSNAQRGSFDDEYFEKAYDTIDQMRDEGYQREAFLLDTVVEKFQG